MDDNSGVFSRGGGVAFGLVFVVFGLSTIGGGVAGLHATEEIDSRIAMAAHAVDFTQDGANVLRLAWLCVGVVIFLFARSIR